MTISSRTPEGLPNRCPLCHAIVALEPSRPFGDAPCPSCGALLWFVELKSGSHLYDREMVASILERMERVLHRAGLSEDSLGTADSLDVVELVMDLEEEFGNLIPEYVSTIAEVIEYYLRHGEGT